MTRAALEGFGRTFGPEGRSADPNARLHEIFGALGPNGAGKTTTVECLQGLRPFDREKVSVLGFDPARQAAELSRQIGSQLQESALPGRIKVWDALDLFGSLSRFGSGLGLFRVLVLDLLTRPTSRPT